MAKETFIIKISVLIRKVNIELRKNLVVLCMDHCIILLRDLDTKKTGGELIGELRNVVLEENGEDKKVRVSN